MRELAALWSSLESESQNSKGRFLLRKLNSIGLHIGIDLVNSRRVLVLETSTLKRSEARDLPKWKGLQLSAVQLEVGTWGLLASLVDLKDTDIFNALIRDFDDALAEAGSLDEALELFTQCLERWRAFFEKYGSSILSPESQRGLFGELYFLKRHVLPRSSQVNAVNYWRGHARKYQDFSCPGGNVEVKTTIMKEPRSVVISSEKQLDDSGLESLYLYCLGLNEAGQSGQSLPGLIAEIRESLLSTPKALLLFNRYLNEAGYIDDHEIHYLDTGCAVAREYMFSIEEGFPRITCLPSGVADVRYSILLSSCTEFQVETENALKILLRERSK